MIGAPVLCVAPNPAIDKLFVTEHVAVGEIHRPERLVQLPGGKGLNVARALKCLGVDVRAACLLGGHAGRWVEQALAELGVAAQVTWCAGETRSALSVFDRSSGKLTEFYERGAVVDGDEWSAFDFAVARAARDASWVAVSGSMPSGAPASGAADLLTAARAAGARSALNFTAQPRTSWRPRLRISTTS